MSEAVGVASNLSEASLTLFENLEDQTDGTDARPEQASRFGCEFDRIGNPMNWWA